jgi:uncharacterized damage-inducible protein DinB
MPFNTIRELFSHNSWGNEKLFDVAVLLSDEQLDRRFDIGPGTLRETMRHIYGAERVWYERVGGPGRETLPHSRDLSDVEDIHAWACRLSAARTAWIDSLADGALDGPIAYVGSDGQRHTARLGDILLHVCNHGVHHRAQVLNMLRRLGVPLPKYGADYIFMYVEDQNRPPPALEVSAVRRYGAYGDWAFDGVLDAAVGLADEQLDQAFEIGLGTLHKTLVHIHDAERWWLRNWQSGPGETFPALDESMSLSELRELFGQTAKRRDAFIVATTDVGLRRPVAALARQGDIWRFPLGVTMLQLCCHGTHHRAQAINMLRHLGVMPPELDLIGWSLTAAGA